MFTESTFMELAVEQFLGKSEEDVKVDFSLTFLIRSFLGMSAVCLVCSHVEETYRMYLLE